MFCESRRVSRSHTPSSSSFNRERQTAACFGGLCHLCKGKLFGKVRMDVIKCAAHTTVTNP